MNDIDLALRATQQSLDNLDDTLREMADLLLEGMPDRAERRRYALLEAAVLLHRDAMEMAARLDLPVEELAPGLAESSVEIAEKLLAAIERREKTEEES